MKNIILVFACLVSTFVQAQYISSITEPDRTIAINTDTNNLMVRYASEVKAEDIRKHLTVLASDEYEGRETGEKGNDMAAEYISSHFAEVGISPKGINGTYYQPITFTSAGWNDTEMSINGEKFKHLWDYLGYPTVWENTPKFTSNEVTFLGYGIDDPKYSDYKGKDVKGKVIMVYSGEPMKKDSTYLITGTKEASPWSEQMKLKLDAAKANGAELVLFVSPELKAFLMKNRKYVLGASLSLGDLTDMNKNSVQHIYISTSMAEAIIGKKQKKVIKARKKIQKRGKSKSVALPVKMDGKFDNFKNLIKGNNVLGYVEGSDLKDEVIVVSAHYDHLGIRGEDIFNGADDNGSGTSTVLDLAEAFYKAKSEGNGPRRSILFLLVTGEEKGLLGSEFFAENPLIPLENIVANVNVDMIGRTDEAHEGNPNYIYVIGSDRLSTELHAINESANQEFTQLTLDYTYNSEDDPNRYYYRSDHYNFAKNGIPAIFYFSGVHEDYHRPSDTVEKIMFDKVAKIGNLIFHTTWKLANREKRIVVDRS